MCSVSDAGRDEALDVSKHHGCDPLGACRDGDVNDFCVSRAFIASVLTPHVTLSAHIIQQSAREYSPYDQAVGLSLLLP